MSDTVIKVENLSKKYIIGHKSQESYLTLRDSMTAQAKAWGRRLLHPFNSAEGGLITADEKEDFWALKDVSFEIKQGDRVGIIGRNGAGKSTLLKLLSRITEPTSGRITIAGRVASLLEVGTGFHPELTGRENIFLNGAILGMSKVDIKRKFDEIVDFAEVEKFLDTPVKRYSSGMYVRLAFAVAAHLEPEILVVDEVLAVGDTQFQKKCLGKMEEVGREGRTVLFVSHNLGVISQLCTQAILLELGIVKKIGDVKECITQYMSSEQKMTTSFSIDKEVNSNKKLVIERICLLSDEGATNGILRNDVSVDMEITFSVEIPGSGYAIGAEISNTQGVFLATSTLDARPLVEMGDFSQLGEYKARLELPIAWFMSGDYSIRVAATIPCIEVLDVFPRELTFRIIDTSSPVAVLGEGRRGAIAPRLKWTLRKV